MSCEFKDLGCYGHCGAIELPLKAKQSGIHSVVWDWQKSSYKIDFGANEEFYLKFPNEFNEVAQIDFRIIQPDGEYYEYSEIDELVNGLSKCTGIIDFRIETILAFDKTCQNDIVYELKADDVDENFEKLYQK